MSNPKTIGELLAVASESMVASHKSVVAEEPEHVALNEGFMHGVAYAADKFKELLDYRIVGPGSVVSPERLEAGVAAAWEHIHPDLPWSVLGVERQESARDTFAAGLGQLGIVVADEVVTQAVDTAGEDKGSMRWLASAYPDEEWSFMSLHAGDRVYIERADTATVSTRCPDTSKNGAGIDKGE